MLLGFSTISKPKKRTGSFALCAGGPVLNLNNLVIMVADSRGFGGSRGTPACNTGLNSQELPTPQLTVKIDWLQLSTLHGSVEDFQQMLKILEEVFSDQITWYSDRPLYRGRYWETSGSSVRGIQVCFDPPKEVNPGRGWVQLPGSLLSQVDAASIHDLCCMFKATWSAVARRLDVAVDDYSKPFNFRLIYDQAKAGNIARVRQSSVGYYASTRNKEGIEGESVVLGSAQSDKRLTFYNKAVESGGDIDAHRVEVRLRDCKADQVFQHIAGMTSEQFEAEAPDYFGGVVIGAVDFVDRSSGDRNIDRLPLLPWWEKFCVRVGSAKLRLAAKKRVQCIYRTLDWLAYQVFPSIAVLDKAIGQVNCTDIIQTLRQAAGANLSEPHKKTARVFRAEWFGETQLTPA